MRPSKSEMLSYFFAPLKIFLRALLEILSYLVWAFVGVVYAIIKFVENWK